MRVTKAVAVNSVVPEPQAELRALADGVEECVRVAVAQGDTVTRLVATAVTEVLAVKEGEPELLVVVIKLVEARAVIVERADADIDAVAEPHAELRALEEGVEDCVSVAVAQGEAEALLLTFVDTETLLLAIVEAEALDEKEGELELERVAVTLAEGKGELELERVAVTLTEGKGELDTVVVADTLADAPRGPEAVGRMDLMEPVLDIEALGESVSLKVRKDVDDAQAEVDMLTLPEKQLVVEKETEGVRVPLYVVLAVCEAVKQLLEVKEPEPVIDIVLQPLLVNDPVAQMLTVSVTLRL